MNQDESTKCITIAKQAILNKDYAKAERFLEKSLKLHATDEAMSLLNRVKSLQKGDTNSQSTTNGNSDNSQREPKMSSQSSKGQQDQSQPQEPPNYSKEDVEKCKSILAKSNYYEILGVQKTATEDELKKAYKKLALKFHPDKNRAPQATDAFKKVSQAFACLSNADKRRIYDQHGTEENFQQRYSQQFHDDEFDADDIFRMFFGGAMFDNRRYYAQQRRPQQRYHYQTRQGQQQDQQQQNPLMLLLIQGGPLLMILLLSVLLNFSTSGYQDNHYNFSYQQNSFYPIQVVSYRLKQNYFVSERAAYDLRNDIGKKYRLDEKVENDIIRRSENMCEDAKRLRTQYINLSKKYSDDSTKYEHYISKAEEIDLNSCVNVKEFKKVVKSYS